MPDTTPSGLVWQRGKIPIAQVAPCAIDRNDSIHSYPGLRSASSRSRNQRRTEARNTPKTRKCGNSGCCFSHIWRISRFSSSGDPRSLRTTSAIAVQRKKKLRLKNFCSNCFIFPYCTAMHTEISRACPAGSSRPRSFSSSLGGSSKNSCKIEFAPT